jgi:cyclomaltodextrinase
MEDVRLGKYQHYKGKIYEVIGVARHSETLEEFVVYRALYYSQEFGKNAIWIRPKKMFLENVIFNGKKVPRFRFLGKKFEKKYFSAKISQISKKR